jgi:hypothetical protein
MWRVVDRATGKTIWEYETLERARRAAMWAMPSYKRLEILDDSGGVVVVVTFEPTSS